MSDDRARPATPRRRALARRAGFIARSPILVAGGAAAGAAVGAILAADRARDALAASMTAATAATATTDAASFVAPSPAAIALAVCSVVAPVVLAALAGAAVVHLGQVRSLFAPRRSVAGAPAPDESAGRRAVDAALGVAHAAIVGGVAAIWIWRHAADLGHLASLPSGEALAGGARLAASALAHLAGAVIVAGAIDFGVALVRHRADLRMTRAEADEDARAAGIDPRWPRRRPRRDDADAAIRQARLVVIGDGAVAIRFHERVAPRPSVVARGHGLDETRLVALARRYRVPIHRAPAIATRLSRLEPGTFVPDALHAGLADLIATAQ